MTFPMSEFTKTISVKRYTAGAYVDGVWQKGTESTFDIQASVQPVNGDDVNLKDEAGLDILKGMKKIYSNTKLQPKDDNGKIPPDLIVIGSETYEVQDQETWDHLDLDYYKYLIMKVKDS